MEVTISFQKQQPHPTLTPKTVSFAPALNIPSTPVFPEAVYVMDRVNHVESDVKRHMQLDPLSLDELMGKRSISREAKTTNGVNMQNAKLAEIRMKEQRKRDTGRTKPALSSTKDNNNSNFTVNDVKEDGGIPYSIMTPQLIAVAAEPNLNIKKNISCYAPQSFSQVLAPPPSLHQSDHNNSSNTCTDSAFDTSVSPPDPSFSLFSTQYQSQFTHYPKLYQQVQNQLFQTQRFSGGKNYHNPTSLLPIRLEPLSNPMNIPSKMRNAR